MVCYGCNGMVWRVMSCHVGVDDGGKHTVTDEGITNVCGYIYFFSYAGDAWIGRYGGGGGGGGESC